MADEDEVEKSKIYEALDNILNNLEKLEKGNDDKETIKYLLHIQTINTKLLYNALKDIDDIQDSLINIIKMLRKNISNEDIEYNNLEEESPTNENDLKKIKSKIEKKTHMFI